MAAHPPRRRDAGADWARGPARRARLGAARRVGGSLAPAAGRGSQRRRDRDSDRRRLLSRLHPRLDADPRGVRDPDLVSPRAAVRDALDAREVRAGWRLDADGARRRAAAVRRPRDAGRARVDPARGGALGGRGRRRLPRRARDHRGRRRAAAAARRLRPPRLVPALPAGVRERCAPVAAPVRRERAERHSAAVPDGVRAARLLCADVAARRRCPLLHAAGGGRRPVGLVDPVPRRRLRRRRDRCRPRDLRPLGARRPGGVDVRAAARGRPRARRARRDRDQPARNHARRGRAPARRCAPSPPPAGPPAARFRSRRRRRNTIFPAACGGRH